MARIRRMIMNNRLTKRTGSFALIFILSGCIVIAPTYERVPVDSGQFFPGNYLNLHSPKSDGWFLLISNQFGMEFARQGINEKDSIGAQVLTFPLAPVDSNNDFVSLIKLNAIRETDGNDRFNLIESEFRYTDERKYPCVRTYLLTEDTKAKISRVSEEALLLEAIGLYCRHPVHKETGFAILYSYRGKSLYSDLSEEAESFINGVNVPGHTTEIGPGVSNHLPGHSREIRSDESNHLPEQSREITPGELGSDLSNHPNHLSNHLRAN